MLWHDRKVDFVDGWICDPNDDVEQALTVLSWPIVLPMLWIYGLKYLIKGVRIFFTATVYLIAALIDKDKEDKK